MAKQTTDNARLWIIENRAGPANVPSYEAEMRASKPEWPRGDPKAIYTPDTANYGQFKVVQTIPGEEQPPTVTLAKRYDEKLSTLLRIRKTACDIDAQIRMGRCYNPADSARGWTKILVLEGISPAGWSIGGDLNVFEPKDRDMVTDEMKFTGENLFEIVRMIYAEQAKTDVVAEVIDIAICDSVSCGSCGTPSDGCQKVFAVTKVNSGSPGLPAELIYSGNQGGTWGDVLIDSLHINDDPSGVACVGSYVAVISQAGLDHHYAEIADVLLETETWTEVTGYNAAGGPNAMFAFTPNHIWVVGQAGYIYKLTDITAVVTATNVQDAGSATTENLLDIHGYDELNLVAVGAANAVVFTTDGFTWTAVTGPAPAVALNAVWMKSETEWFVGDAGGNLWYTRNSGTTWVAKGFPGSGSGAVEDIKFSNDTVGFMSHTTAAGKGRILRTVDGGYSWVVAPEGDTSVPDNDKLNALAVCPYDVNLVFGAGLNTNAVDGIIIKGYGS